MPYLKASISVVLFFFCLLPIASCNQPGLYSEQLKIQSDSIRIVVKWGDGLLTETFEVLSGSGWNPVASSAGKSSGAVTLEAVEGRILYGKIDRVYRDEKGITEELAFDAYRVVRTLRITGDTPWVSVRTSIYPKRPERLHAFVDRYGFSGNPEWSYLPGVKGYAPDLTYQAPLSLIQDGQESFGIVPDVRVLDKKVLDISAHTLQMNVLDSPWMSVGFLPVRVLEHEVYDVDPAVSWMIQDSLSNVYYLFVSGEEKFGYAYRKAIRFHWAKFGRAEQLHAAKQQAGTTWKKVGPGWEDRLSFGLEDTAAYLSLALFEDWRKATWHLEAPSMWLSVPLPDGSIGGAVQTRRLFERSVYNGSWFNSMRTSYGMALYAHRNGLQDLLDLAAQTLQLGLKAPGIHGAFKCIAGVDPDVDHVNWAAGDGQGASTVEGFLGYDMSWTAYWMLRWYQDRLPGYENVLDRARRLARFFIERQEADGQLPTRFNEDGSVDQKTSAMVFAETGPVLLFLLQLYENDPKPEYLQAAVKGIGFLENQVIPLRKWYDYETFWSCAQRALAYDPITGQWPANNLALSQSVAAYLQAWKVTGEYEYLEKGQALLDYALLYQQVWTNPRAEGLNSDVMLLGGFSTQNNDNEWSDARQSQYGNILLDYYRATGTDEYLERGVAALRAQFPVSPSENWIHGSTVDKAGISSFHWGTGSGMAGIEIDHDFLKDAVVDVTAGIGVGVNGINVLSCRIEAEAIDLVLESPFQWTRNPVIVFYNATPDRRYSLTVNNEFLGYIPIDRMESGMEISTRL